MRIGPRDVPTDLYTRAVLRDALAMYMKDRARKLSTVRDDAKRETLETDLAYAEDALDSLRE